MNKLRLARIYDPQTKLVIDEKRFYTKNMAFMGQEVFNPVKSLETIQN